MSKIKFYMGMISMVILLEIFSFQYWVHIRKKMTYSAETDYQMECFTQSFCDREKNFDVYVSESLSGFENRNLLSGLSNGCHHIIVLDMNQDVFRLNVYLENLPYWFTQLGRNHILYLVGDDAIYCENLKRLKVLNAVLVMPMFCNDISYRNDWWFLVPLVRQMNHSQNLLPVKREFLITHVSITVPETWISKQLSNIHDSKIVHRTKESCSVIGENVDSVLTRSMFVVIIQNSNPCFMSDIIFAFEFGVVPIVIGRRYLLPYADLIDWNLALLFLNENQNISDVLSALKYNDIFALKKQGRFLLEAYFMSVYHVLKTTIETINYRYGIQPEQLEEVTPKTVIYKSNQTDAVEQKPTYHTSRVNMWRHWNVYPGGLHFIPVTPWLNVFPSFYQFTDYVPETFEPIEDGRSGGKKETFQKSLGGDHPIEMFTVVILVYNRDTVLRRRLRGLLNLKYLHKVLVVCNHPTFLSNETEWMDMGLKFEVIRAPVNSLNNRFIPYSSIETEAVFSLDDDVRIPQDAIELAFRTWRENRDQIVGFPAKSHIYNRKKHGFDYNHRRGCEISMILTGAAFFHKYYMFVYTYLMHLAIRNTVDRFMNCEDIAMNFLVAHITKKPPIKVSGISDFRCRDCNDTLSNTKKHHYERNDCMVYFTNTYGYNPLRRTQLRVNSMFYGRTDDFYCYRNV